VYLEDYLGTGISQAGFRLSFDYCWSNRSLQGITLCDDTERILSVVRSIFRKSHVLFGPRQTGKYQLNKQIAVSWNLSASIGTNRSSLLCHTVEFSSPHGHLCTP
jgi:hypothetical protein